MKENKSEPRSNLRHEQNSVKRSPDQQGGQPSENRGSAPLPNEAFNRGDNLYDEKKAKDKNFLKDKMRSNTVPENDPDKLAEEADKKRTRKPGSQGNSSDRHNNGRGGGK